MDLQGNKCLNENDADNEQESSDSEQKESKNKMEESGKENEKVTNKKAKIVAGTDKKTKEDNQVGKECNDYKIHFTKESSDNEDLFDVEAMQKVKSPSDDPNSGSGCQVKEQRGMKSIAAKNKGKEATKDVYEHTGKELSDGLHSPPL